ncbi:zinc-ribbon domain-containing protein [Piscinibacter gummiphilus]|uniref:zinc-ribbon domain-containing protein n=1 Tax=Piscinibacter gummiphilus TaxID=946333 RepID=UPI00387EA0B6
MIFFFGRYRFSPRRYGFRNEFCTHCNASRRVESTVTSDFLHLFWIPLIPIGDHETWSCTTCGKAPHGIQRTRYSFKIAGLLLLAFGSFAIWFTPIEPGDEAIAWVMRLALPVGLVATAFHLVRIRSKQSTRVASSDAEPTTDTSCPYCEVPLLDQPDWHCGSCGVRRL